MSRLPLAAALLLSACARGSASAGDPGPAAPSPVAVADATTWPADPAGLSDAQWKERLSPMQYKVLRQAGTELAFTGPYWDSHDDGVYRCAGCGQPLFTSTDKFDSGTGWPSYTRPVSEAAVQSKLDVSHGMVRLEAVCSRCGGHLGHVFDDGPAPTGQRWCINGAALSFEPAAP
jgi:peptide-methionine (R)-S-oxide reductase